MTGYNKVFIDTAPLIYYLEQNPQCHKKVKDFIGTCLEYDIQIVTSSITIAEYCVFPLRRQKLELIQKLDEFIDDMKIDLVNINEAIAKKSAQIRAMYKYFKAMDALQLAAAYLTECDLFLTNDKQLRQFTEMKCVTVEDL